MSTRRPVHPSTPAAVGAYVLLLAAAILEQFGKTTNDTKTPLITAPEGFLRGVLSLWSSQTSMGELQNQAYGYLFPQGPFFLLGQLGHVPPWITERLWSTLILVVGCEGGRWLARSMAMRPWPALVAGLAYGLSPRVIAQVGTRTGEILPAAVLPWVLLPIVLAIAGRLTVRRAALFSAAAFLFSGALNATATVAGLPIVVITIVWAARRGLVRWNLLGWWSGFVVISSIWWAESLLKLRTYSPPFFDYVEDAKTTTGTTGYTSALRGSSNWINYIFLGDKPVWPAGAEFAYRPWLVAASGILAAVSVLGLVRWRNPWRTPMVIGAVFGLVCLEVGHSWVLGSPLHGSIQDRLDNGFDLLRNVVKIDPVLRLPLALGAGAAAAQVAEWAAGWRTRRRATASRRRRLLGTASGWTGVGLVVALTVAMAQPALALNLRTPGWTSVPSYWQRTSDYLAAQGGDSRAWVIPGAGFGIQTWGWTVDEPMASVATTPWVTRSQVPLTPPETIRVLSQLEEYLDTGSGSPNLGAVLARLGIGYVVVRHDLDPSLAEATSSSEVSIALARSQGVTRVTQYGTQGLGPAIEIYKVDTAAATDLSVVPQSSVVTVAGASSDVTNAVGQGLIAPGRAAIVQGDSGWDQPAQLVGDSYRLRERDFGLVHDAEGPVLAPDEPTHSTRLVGNYPGNPGSKPVYAQYTGVQYVTASSSYAYTDGLGAVHPEAAPFAAVDSDPQSMWQSALLQHEVGQWLDVRLPSTREIGPLRVVTPVANPNLGEIETLRVDAGSTHRSITIDPFTGAGTVDLTGVKARDVRLTVVKVKDPHSQAPIGISELTFDGLPAERTLVVPQARTTTDPDFVFTARPEVRTCITTLLAPDCDLARGRDSDESLGIDRTIDVDDTGRFSLSGTVVARARPGTLQLLNPQSTAMVVRASSTLDSDPTVSVRMAYDGSQATTWMADPYDPDVTLTVDFDRPRTISTIGVGQPASPAIAPTQAVIRSGDDVRTVSLGGFGAFQPLRTRHLTISLSNPDQGLAPLGLSELYLGPKPVTAPIDGAAATGAVCGLGPQVVVDGTTFQTKVDGFIGNVISAGPLQLSLCDERGGTPSIDLAAGEHHVQILSTDQFQPVLVALTSTGSNAEATTSAPDRTFKVTSDGSTQQSLDVGPGAAAILRTTRNYNLGWRATLDGKTLPVQRVDGWAQGWRLPAGKGGEVRISFAPERSYVVFLTGGLVLAGLVLLAAIVLLFRTRLTPPQPLPERRADDERPVVRRRRVRAAALLLVVSALAWVLGGVPALAGVAIAVALVRLRPAVPMVLAAVLLVGGPVLNAIWIQQGRSSQVGWADLLTGTGFVLAVAVSVLRPPSVPPETVREGPAPTP